LPNLGGFVPLRRSKRSRTDQRIRIIKRSAPPQSVTEIAADPEAPQRRIAAYGQLGVAQAGHVTADRSSGPSSGAHAGNRQHMLTRPNCQHKLTDMEKTLELAEGAASNDPEVGLRAVAALRVLTERLEMLQVDNARALGWSWQEIASRLGVTKQTVHRKHGRRAGGR
jgi:hypothetical protein